MEPAQEKSSRATAARRWGPIAAIIIAAVVVVVILVATPSNDEKNNEASPATTTVAEETSSPTTTMAASDSESESDDDSESESENSQGELFSTTVFGPDPAYVNLRNTAYNSWRNFDDITKTLIAADIFENIEKPDKLLLSNRLGEYTDEEIKGVNCIQYIMKCFRSERYTIENEQLTIHEDIEAN